MANVRTPDGRLLPIPEGQTAQQVIEADQQSGEAPAPAGGRLDASVFQRTPAPAPSTDPTAALTEGMGMAPPAAPPPAAPPPAGGRLPASIWDRSSTSKGEIAARPDIIPESPFWNTVAQNLFGPAAPTAAAAEREIAGAVRGTRQVLNEFMGDEEKVKQLEAEEQAARVRDAPLMRTGQGKVGSTLGTAATFLGPAGLISKLDKIRKAAPAMRAITQGLTAAGTAGLTTPNAPGETRMDDMLTAGVIGGIVPAALPALKMLPFTSRLAEGAENFFTSRGARTIKDEAGKQIEKLTGKIQLDPRVLARHLRKDPDLPASANRAIGNIQALTKLPKTGPVSGATVQEMRKRAGAGARAAAEKSRKGGASPQEAITGSAFEKMIGRLDDAVIAAAPDKLAKALKKARAQYRTGERPMSAMEVIRSGGLPAMLQGLTDVKDQPVRPVRKPKEK